MAHRRITTTPRTPNNTPLVSSPSMARKRDQRKLPEGIDRPFWDTREMARMQQVTLDTLRHWRQTGTGPPFIVISGAQIIYPKDLYAGWQHRKARMVQKATHRRKKRKPARQQESADAPP